ncbi:MAG: ATP-dependent helicase [bacterium]|nr:ATP-dependent helicase [bacterium]
MSFSKLYSILNPAQKQAVDTLDGPVMVLAGPGTGKTQVLTLRIANILKKTDTPPYAVTALTYTEAAAENMIHRLAQIIGQTAYQVNISTFHSFAGRIIKQNPDKFPYLRTGRPINIIEKINLIEDILARHKFFHLRPFGNASFYVKPLIFTLSTLKREAIPPDTLANLINQAELEPKRKAKLTELVRFYRLYQKQLAAQGLYDFEDMINHTLDSLAKDHDLSLSVQEKVLYLLIDEYQDTNSAQNKLIAQLSSFWGQAANIFVVGDNDQSIFRFQGASQANFIFFHKLFPKAKLINLNLNYRSHPAIINVTEHFIQNQRQSLSRIIGLAKSIQPAKPAKTSTPRIHLHHFSSLTQEAEFIAQKIKSLIKQGVPPEEISLIYKENKDALVYAPFLNKESIPYTINGQVDILSQPSTQYLLRLIKVIHLWGQPEAEPLLFTVLNFPFFNLKAAHIGQAFRQAHQNKSSFTDLYLTRPKKFEPIWQIIDLFESLKKDSLKNPLPLFIQNLLESTGLLAYLINSTGDKHQLFYLYTFFNQIKTWYRDKIIASIEDLIINLDLLQKHQIPLEAEPLFTNAKAIKLTTAHKAKGQEFQYVFIAQFIDKKWSHKTVPSPLPLPASLVPFHQEQDQKKEKEKEEQRLFYVALTRAKKHVFITIPSTIWSDGVIKPTNPASFVHQLPPSQVTTKNHQDSLASLEKTIISLFKPAPEPEITHQYWRPLLQKLKISPTALNTFLACPYQFLLNNLFRLPRTKSPNLIMGSAIHKAFEEWLIAYKQSPKKANLENIIQIYNNYLENEILAPAEQERIKTEGAVLLDRFYQDQLTPQLKNSQPFKSELDFSSQPIFTPENIPITGKIDRIDRLDDNRYLIIDYKTGRVPTKKALNDPDQDYRRQLTFYALLLDTQPEFIKSKLTFALWFIGTRSQKPLFFNFTPTDQEKLNLRQTLKAVWQKIQSLDFPRTNDRRLCRICPYRFHCFPHGLPPTPKSDK